MTKIIIKRLLQAIPTLLVVVTITFILTRMIPGDPVTAMVGDQADPAVIEEIREEMGFNDPLIVQYGRYIKDIFTGNFGRSYYYNLPTLEVIADRIPNTLVLAVISSIIAIVVGVFLGVVSSVKQYSIVDYFFTFLSLLGISLPVFWLGLMLVLLFSVNLGWLPTLGMGSMANGLWDYVSHLILPCICLALIPMASFARTTRASMIETFNNDSIRALRAKGIGEKSVVWKHALKNALPPIVTVIGMRVAGIFAGAVLTENIFAWPGMGTMISNAIENRDYALIQAAVLVVAIAFVAINLIVDIIFTIINPKVTIDGI